MYTLFALSVFNMWLIGERITTDIVNNRTLFVVFPGPSNKKRVPQSV